jgi:hypothetical protein
MKDREMITCPKLRAKKLREKEERNANRKKQSLNKFTPKTTPVEHATTAFAGMATMMDENDRVEAATQIQKIVRRCIAECKVKQMLQEKAKKKANKGKKKRKQTEKVFYCEPCC